MSDDPERIRWGEPAIQYRVVLYGREPCTAVALEFPSLSVTRATRREAVLDLCAELAGRLFDLAADNTPPPEALPVDAPLPSWVEPGGEVELMRLGRDDVSRLLATVLDLCTAAALRGDGLRLSAEDTARLRRYAAHALTIYLGGWRWL